MIRLIFVLFILHTSQSIFAQKVLVVHHEHKQIEIEDKYFIQDIYIRQSWFKKSKKHYINQAVASTIKLGGNCIVMEYWDENPAMESIKTRGSVLQGRVYNIPPKVMEEIKSQMEEIDRIRLAEKNKRYEEYKQSNTRLYGGISYGRETLIGLPKISLVRHLSNSRLQPYVSVDASLFGIQALIVNLGLNIGVRMDFLSLDNSISYAYVHSDNSYGYSSVNPKIGIHIGDLWIKGGPSIYLKKPRSSRIIPYNFEVLYRLKF